MDPNAHISAKSLHPELQNVIDQHSHVLRLSYMEIVSGINRLLRQGIPKEVVAQVLTQAVEALAKEVHLSPRHPNQ